MAKRGGRVKTKLLAKLVTENQKPCAFCQREVDDEITYGKLYSIGDIQCHYFCVLLSCCLVQKGKDEEGLFGFLYPDILAELERSKKHRCSYCSKTGATLGCVVSQCRKQFHLPCGRERNAVSLFHGNYKSFCKNHAPKQKVSDNVMAKVKQRMQNNRLKKAGKEVIEETVDDEDLKAETVCVICYEEVDCFPTADTFWPPCCARDAWFHRSCVQRMSLSAGMHYLKCPLCNDKEVFYQAVLSQGFYVPDRDAAWELEQNAFAEIYTRELRCGLQSCSCPEGRDHDDDTGPWDIKLCLLCGGSGAHASCLIESGCTETRYICVTCAPAAPDDIDALASNIENVIQLEQARSRPPPVVRRVMPSRMSLRRTKQRQDRGNPSPSLQSSSQINIQETSTSTSRSELNLKPPKRHDPQSPPHSVLKDIENKLFSPVKMIEEGLRETVGKFPGHAEKLVLDPSVVEKVRMRFRKPKPLSEKKRIVKNILDDLLHNMLKEKPKIKEWCSPKKESVQEILPEEKQADENSTGTDNLDIKPEQIDYKTSTPIKSTENIKEQNVNNKSPIPIRATDANPRLSETTENIEPELSIVPENVETISIDSDKEDLDIKSNEIDIDSKDLINEEDKVMCAKEESVHEEEKTIVIDEDDSSNSTFHLPPEFIGEDSDASIFDTPKKKTVEIQKDSSMEISEDNDVVNIDLVEIKNTDTNLKNDLPSPVKEKCSLKFSPNKESLEANKMDIDIESFKNQYLNEVDKGFQCNFNHKHKNDSSTKEFKLQTAIDFALDATMKAEKYKRKVKNAKNQAKKRKHSSLVLKYENVDIKKRKKDKIQTVSIQNDNMKVKISLKKQKFKLKIMQSKSESPPKNLKQYVLKCSDGKSNEMIGKPEKDVTPIKRKYIKQEKSPDNLVQTSIQSFFKGKSPKE